MILNVQQKNSTTFQKASKHFLDLNNRSFSVTEYFHFSCSTCFPTTKTEGLQRNPYLFPGDSSAKTLPNRNPIALQLSENSNYGYTRPPTRPTTKRKDVKTLPKDQIVEENGYMEQKGNMLNQYQNRFYQPENVANAENGNHEVMLAKYLNELLKTQNDRPALTLPLNISAKQERLGAKKPSQSKRSREPSNQGKQDKKTKDKSKQKQKRNKSSDGVQKSTSNKDKQQKVRKSSKKQTNTTKPNEKNNTASPAASEFDLLKQSITEPIKEQETINEDNDGSHSLSSETNFQTQEDSTEKSNMPSDYVETTHKNDEDTPLIGQEKPEQCSNNANAEAQNKKQQKILTAPNDYATSNNSNEVCNNHDSMSDLSIEDNQQETKDNVFSDTDESCELEENIPHKNVTSEKDTSSDKDEADNSMAGEDKEPIERNDSTDYPIEEDTKMEGNKDNIDTDYKKPEDVNELINNKEPETENDVDPPEKGKTSSQHSEMASDQPEEENILHDNESDTNISNEDNASTNENTDKSNKAMENNELNNSIEQPMDDQNKVNKPYNREAESGVSDENNVPNNDKQRETAMQNLDKAANDGSTDAESDVPSEDKVPNDSERKVPGEDVLNDPQTGVPDEGNLQRENNGPETDEDIDNNTQSQSEDPDEINDLDAHENKSDESKQPTNTQDNQPYDPEIEMSVEDNMPNDTETTTPPDEATNDNHELDNDVPNEDTASTSPEESVMSDQDSIADDKSEFEDGASDENDPPKSESDVPKESVPNDPDSKQQNDSEELSGSPLDDIDLDTNVPDELSNDILSETNEPVSPSEEDSSEESEENKQSENDVEDALDVDQNEIQENETSDKNDDPNDPLSETAERLETDCQSEDDVQNDSEVLIEDDKQDESHKNDALDESDDFKEESNKNADKSENDDQSEEDKENDSDFDQNELEKSDTANEKESAHEESSETDDSDNDIPSGKDYLKNLFS